MKSLACVAPFLLALPALSQHILTTHSLSGGDWLKQLRHVGDTDGDGVTDFVVRIGTSSATGDPFASTVKVFSGSSGQTLLSLAPALVTASADVAGIGDVNGDARSDIAIVANGFLRVLSGTNGALLFNSPSQANEGFLSTCELGDFDGNGIPDFAGLAKNYNTNQLVVRIFRGQNGSQITSLAPLNPWGTYATIRNLGDVTGDGKSDLAISTDEGPVYAQRTDSGALLWSTPALPMDSYRTIETSDLDGDGQREVIHIRPNTSADTATVYGSNGVVRFTITAPVGSTVDLRPFACALGDLDQDGFRDFALSFHGIDGQVQAISGRNGATLWTLQSIQPSYLGECLATLGDVDGDGFGDFAVGTLPINFGMAPKVHVVSGRILAESQPKGGACGGGPFFPQLGTTRPILGQTVTIAGQNGPVGVNGIVVWSLQPLYPSYLGASSCTAWFDLGAGFALAPVTQPQWALSVPLPLVPQFAGLEIALQCFYAPTTGPLGYDLSNGIWARLGYQ